MKLRHVRREHGNLSTVMIPAGQPIAGITASAEPTADNEHGGQHGRDRYHYQDGSERAHEIGFTMAKGVGDGFT